MNRLPDIIVDEFHYHNTFGYIHTSIAIITTI